MKHPFSIRASRHAGVLSTIAAAALLAGCSPPLFSPDEPRSQYDRMDRVRERQAAPYYYDEFGDRKPNLRQRVLANE